ncbi:hypothetical protein SBOR_5550 [Sclerotinia borealis F-4128]|uniref:DNA replication factor Cdt1 C-terminal domain-containing protein n=1 Tax=Sclerotinia borealis (strain F-4128) TaxID=1432307 RepID=W9CH51_SCLBF|nr:hypothetical protein SBOR_5550 [Sclerotinia borealis F-4128]
MPSAIKKRKVAATTSRNAATTKIQPLSSFTTISKASTNAGADSIIDKNKQVDGLPVTVTELDKPSTNLRKRKLDTEEEPNVIEIATTVKDIKTRPQSILPSKVPQTPQKLIKTTSITTETPTKGARTLLDRLLLQTPKRPVLKRPSLSPLRSISSSSGSNTSILPPKHSQTHANEGKGEEEAEPQEDSIQSLPTELIEIINLHASLLTTLTLHCAHNGSNAPADLRNLCPDIARAWGKRKVILDDIRQALGILNYYISTSAEDQKLSTITLSDYGSGKICVEIEAENGKGNNLRPIDEERLNGIFTQGLIARWEAKGEDITVDAFTKELPIESITPCSSLSKMTPLLAKGQRRLEDMKAGVIVKRDLRKTKSSPALIEAATSTSTEKKPTLLERLRAKQLRQSLLPQAPSPAQVARKAALSRMEEVVKVLSILSTSGSAGQQRISFTMPTLIGKLKDSFKTPISKDEAITVVKLFAEEIAPEWVQLAKMGKMEAVVFDRERRVGEEGIRERIQKAQSA